MYSETCYNQLKVFHIARSGVIRGDVSSRQRRFNYMPMNLVMLAYFNLCAHNKGQSGQNE